jgi:hypothetical protein
MRIAVLTSGVESCGMNPAIRMAVAVALARRHTPLGVRDGFVGLIAGELERLRLEDVDGITRTPGTILGTSEAPELETPLGLARAVATLEAWCVGGLLVIGGAGSVAGAHALAGASQCAVVVVPSTLERVGAASPDGSSAGARAIAQRLAFEAILALEDGATDLLLGWDVAPGLGQPTEDPRVARVRLDLAAETLTGLAGRPAVSLSA